MRHLELLQQPLAPDEEVGVLGQPLGDPVGVERLTWLGDLGT